MQNLRKRAPIVYGFFLLLVSVAAILFYTHDYGFIVSNEAIWFAVSVAAEGILAAMCLSKRNESTTMANVVALSLPLLALIYIAGLFLLIRGVNDLLFALNGLLCFLSCYILSLLYKNKRVLQGVCTVLNSILLLIVMVGMFLFVALGQIGQDTIVRQEPSPDRTYTAILIDSDHGALGGDTVVNVEYRASVLHLGFGRFVKTKNLYIGDWGEYKNMRLSWKDDSTLLINGRSYVVD